MKLLPNICKKRKLLVVSKEQLTPSASSKSFPTPKDFVHYSKKLHKNTQKDSKNSILRSLPFRESKIYIVRHGEQYRFLMQKIFGGKTKSVYLLPLVHFYKSILKHLSLLYNFQAIGAHL